MSESQGIGVAWPLAALGLAAAAIFAPAPAAAVLGTLAVAALTVPIVAGCFTSEPERPCGWTQPQRERPCECAPAVEREPEQTGRNWVETTARDLSVSRRR
jgi:hypothetical protein